ncbi:PH domain-containing protein [Halogeometricum borinquense]|uniref:PH domain-containing protein n=1 Tax=Halogeometricum borinquense TaxID=60847 RepID=A0A6C0UE81_9EURY|nr:PH domain-containing protein [Halogeometricum borinquense]QIB73675.1 PH domain-containing protein [Halogeometricum borinquense]QIQ76968.1 PH domain-containing protein [Halogeometricum borinquense]
MATQHLSPLSVPYRVLQRGGSIVAALGFALATGGFSLPFAGLTGPLVLVGLASLFAIALVAYEFAYYRRFTYELTADTFDIESGVFARRNREIPLRRIQNVDISRNVIQRAMGIAAVSFETAGGTETEAKLRFVSFEEAKRLQRELGRLKRGESADEDADTPVAEELFKLEGRELGILGALSFDFRVPGIIFLFFSGSLTVVTSLFPSDLGPVVVVLGTFVLLLLVILASWITGAAIAIVNYYGFRLVQSADELQYERGLLQRYDGSIPFDKVQTLTIADNPLKRWAGYATLLVETAGYAPGQGDSGPSRGSEAAVPIASRDRIEGLVNDIEPVGSPDFRRPPKRTRRRYFGRYSIVIGAATAVLSVAGSVASLGLPWYAPLALIPVAAVAAHYKWKHRGLWLGENHVVTRNGVLKRETKIVPYYRIQTIIDSRTVFQRRLRLATVTIDTAGSLSLGGQDAAAVDIDTDYADELRDELESRLRVAVAAHRQGRVGIGADDELSVTESVEQSKSERDGTAGTARSDSDDAVDNAADGATDGPVDDATDDAADPFVWDTASDDNSR